MIEAEARLLDRATSMSAPTVRPNVLARVIGRSAGPLSRQQGVALEGITTSGRQVDLLVGPAGAGKTTAMRALRSAWIVEHGQGSIVGLAPSAAAAQALADDLGITSDNTAKWLHEYDHGRTELRSGQLVIVDEATLAGTTSLDRITGIAAGAGAKVLLVGDPRQLQSVDAGGVFALLVDRRADSPELTQIHRFSQEWGLEASLALSRGDIEVISTYVRQHRIREGLTDQMFDAAYEAWRADTISGVASVLVTESSQAVRALNERARAHRLLLDGAVDSREVHLVDGSRACVGDVVITRRNDRTLQTMSGCWVKNGDRWRITDIRGDGTVVVSCLTRHMVTGRAIAWTPHGDHLRAEAHFEFQPALVKAALVDRVCAASDEFDAQRRFLATGLDVVQVNPGVLTHSGENRAGDSPASRARPTRAGIGRATPARRAGDVVVTPTRNPRDTCPTPR